MITRLLFLITFVSCHFLLCINAYSATFETVLSKYSGAEMGLLLRGEIVQGDADRLEKALDIAIAQYPDHRMRAIALDSPGGLVDEAIKMANLIHKRGLAVMVPDKASCVSACVLMFAAGSDQVVSTAGRLGVHGISNGEGQQDSTALAATTNLAKLYADLGVPASVIGRMVVTPPEKITWLTSTDIALFPRAEIIQFALEDFPRVGDRGEEPLQGPYEEPLPRHTQAYRDGYQYGYNHPDDCRDIELRLHDLFDAPVGCAAGVEAARRDNRVGPIVVAPTVPKATFNPAPPHSAQLVNRATQFANGYKSGFLTDTVSKCQSATDWCRGYSAGRELRRKWTGPFPTETELAKTDSAQAWLDDYDDAYSHKNRGDCGNGSSPSNDGCSAGAMAWPRTERQAN
jgi:hypothetical protein